MGRLAQKSSKQCSILHAAEAGWVKDDRTSKKGGKTPSAHCWTLQQPKCCSCAQPCAPWPESSHQSWIWFLDQPNLHFPSYSHCKTLQIQWTVPPTNSSTVLPQKPESSSFSLTLCIQFWEQQRWIALLIPPTLCSEPIRRDSLCLTCHAGQLDTQMRLTKMLVIYLGPDPVEHMLNYNQDVQPVDFKGTIPPV